MLLVNPKADVPVVQVSILSSEDPAKHYAMGKALAKLRDSNVAIVGSGFASFHNLLLWRSIGLDDPDLQQKNVAWSKAVTDASTTKNVEERGQKFAGWRNWPFGKEMHPFPAGGDHFMPLIVCAGAGENEAAEYYTDNMQRIEMYSYYWK
jgi:aromatic ring-opening dioxygenase catalytic subunit (LigB family)